MSPTEVLSVLVIITVTLYVASSTTTSALAYIPSINGPRWSYYIAAADFLRNAQGFIQDGYIKHARSVFKVPMLDTWGIVVNDPDMFKDIRKAPSDQLSFGHAIAEIMQTPITMGPEIRDHPWHLPAIREHLTRNLDVKFDEMWNEIQDSFKDLIDEPMRLTGVYATPMHGLATHVVARTANRIFVGLPFCRSKEYLTVAIGFTLNVITVSKTLNLFPRVMRPLVARFIPNVAQMSIKRSREILGPLIQSRMDEMDSMGAEWSTKRPNDLVSWLLDVAPPEARTMPAIAKRVLSANFAAIFTTSGALTNAMFYLAASPELAIPLREEIEDIIKQEGWSKAALDKMQKLDSFAKESQRMVGTGVVVSHRRVLHDFTFSNGTTVPTGNIIVVPALAIHLDESNYPEPGEFRPFRFSDLASSGSTLKNKMTTLSSSWMLFGQGRNACPGRFFAVTELKAMLAHVILSYDIQLEGERKIPPNPRKFGLGISPDPTAKVVFRPRATENI